MEPVLVSACLLGGWPVVAPDIGAFAEEPAAGPLWRQGHRLHGEPDLAQIGKRGGGARGEGGGHLFHHAIDHDQAGLGLALGYPALVLDDMAEPVAGWLLHADGLQQHWPELDAFEGIAYRRIATEVFTGCGDKLTAYLYELAEGAEHVE